MPATLLVRAVRTIIPFVAISITIDARAGSSFTDVTDALDISYERVRSAEYAIAQAVQAASLIDPIPPEGIVGTPLMPHGLPAAVVFDHDGDGDLDVFVTNGPGAPNALLVNQLADTGTFGFVDDAAGAGVAAVAMDGAGACAGDVDNDGDPDLLVLGRAQPSRLFENLGDGSFAAVPGSGLDQDSRFHTACAFGDVDGDGLVDVAVSNAFAPDSLLAIFAVPFDLNQHNQLFLNDGGLTFSDVSASAGLEDTDMPVPGAAGISWAVSMVDVDMDGDVDIVFADDQGGIPTRKTDPIGGVDRGFLHVLHNDGTGGFTDVAQNYAPESPGSWMGLAFGDLDCDGALDMFGSNFGDYAFPSIGMPYQFGDQASRWYLGVGDGSFDEVPAGEGTAFGWGAAIFDVDNDGDSDIVYHGGLEMTFVGLRDNPGVVLENDGLCSGAFTTDVAALGARHLQRNTRAVATGDLDRDGFVDIVTVANWTVPAGLPLVPSPASYGSTLDATAFFLPLFQPTPDGRMQWSGVELAPGDLMIELNDGNANGAVTLRPLGTVGLVAGGAVNRSGIGAVVSFRPHGGVTSIKPITGGSSHSSAHATEAYFGLGTAPFGRVDVLWPGGVRNRLYAVHAGEDLLLPEIPCSIDTGAGFVTYKKCVAKSLKALRAQGVISKYEQLRLLISALIAYFEEH